MSVVKHDREMMNHHPRTHPTERIENQQIAGDRKAEQKVISSWKKNRNPNPHTLQQYFVSVMLHVRDCMKRSEC